MAVRDSSCRVELVYQWIQSLIVEAQSGGILGIPPPILTRSFQELSGGMVNFHDAMKVADTPFPFPYLQTCDILLFVLYISAPFVVSTYTNTWFLAGFFCFVLIFTFSCLTLTGLELEFPFGRDANDIQGADLQLEMNHKLKLLVTAASWRAPQLRRAVAGDEKQLQTSMIRCITSDAEKNRSSFAMLWHSLPLVSPDRRRSDASASSTPDPTQSADMEKSEGRMQPEFSATKSTTKKRHKPARRNAKMRSRRMKASPLTECYLEGSLREVPVVAAENPPPGGTANTPAPTKTPTFNKVADRQAASPGGVDIIADRAESSSEGVGLTV